MKKISNPIANAEQEASILKLYAQALSDVAESNNQQEKLLAIDHNLKLWVEIESSIKNKNNILPENIKQNLFKLANFVKYMTMSKGVQMTKQDILTLSNINNEISLGMEECVKNNLAAEEAYSLLRCAMDLSKAQEKNNKKELAAALNNNMELWVYIKTLAKSKKNHLPDEIKGNLHKLADFVSQKTIEIGKNLDNINVNTLETMINTNLQISQGLMAKQMEQLKK